MRAYSIGYYSTGRASSSSPSRDVNIQLRRRTNLLDAKRHYGLSIRYVDAAGSLRASAIPDHDVAPRVPMSKPAFWRWYHYAHIGTLDFTELSEASRISDVFQSVYSLTDAHGVMLNGNPPSKLFWKVGKHCRSLSRDLLNTSTNAGSPAM